MKEDNQIKITVECLSHCQAGIKFIAEDNGELEQFGYGGIGEDEVFAFDPECAEPVEPFPFGTIVKVNKEIFFKSAEKMKEVIERTADESLNAYLGI